MRLWRVHLVDKPVFVNNDHRTLQSIPEQKTCSQRLDRWLNELGSYQPLFRWIPGTSNVVADSIFRNPACEPTESAQHVSLASLLRQLTDQQEEPVADNAFPNYMAARPSISTQCIRLYPRDVTYGRLYEYLSTRTDTSTPPPVETFVNASHVDWDEMLGLAEFAYNARVHSSIRMAPFTADLGYIPRPVADLAMPTIRGTTGKRKLAPRFIGPYPVLKSTTPDTYQLGLPPGLQLHDEFHASYLRPNTLDSNPRRLNDVPRLIRREGFDGLQVQAILQRRVKAKFSSKFAGMDAITTIHGSLRKI
ncbi:hypothetical protein F442_22726 [Phytophthora nicotianae P10297]|uniref:Tf2-1-like SH3-like domain-containing protein n=1 Tax=Phytophthora nicotianae P10297 TaxID=1317064 RepID=W2Y1C2_PHYNI|nr:hypothetical protein F442_22726 [Phytophthora nicotianae P10297]